MDILSLNIRIESLFILLFLVLGLDSAVLAQNKAGTVSEKLTEEPIEGKDVPKYTFVRVKNYKKFGTIEKLDLRELKGKWALLYFWTRNCTPCIYSFPKLDAIQKKQSDRLQVLLVGINDIYNKNIEAYYDGVKNAQRIQLPIAYDTGLVKKWNIISASTIVLINPNGIVEKVFLSEDLSVKKMKALLRRRYKMKEGT